MYSGVHRGGEEKTQWRGNDLSTAWFSVKIQVLNQNHKPLRHWWASTSCGEKLMVDTREEANSSDCLKLCKLYTFSKHRLNSFALATFLVSSAGSSNKDRRNWDTSTLQIIDPSPGFSRILMKIFINLISINLFILSSQSTNSIGKSMILGQQAC